MSRSSSTASNVRQQHGECNEAREPEEHGEDLGSQDSEFMCSGWVSCGCDDQVDEGEKCPYGGEDQEVDLGRRPPPCPVAGSCEVSVRSLLGLRKRGTYHMPGHQGRLLRRDLE
jgi:hypothetical protein